MEKDNLSWKSTVRCEPQTLSDIQENTKELQQLRKLIENWLMYSLAAIIIIVSIFIFWALPVFRLLVNRLLSVN